MNHVLVRLGLCGVLLAAAGCSRGPTLAPVTGTVTLGGKALANIQVEFWPEGSAPRSTGMTDEAGRFTLVTDGAGKPGAVVGPHRVVLHDLNVYEALGFRPREDTNIKEKPARFPFRYTDAQQTPLKFMVEASGNQFEIPVNAK